MCGVEKLVLAKTEDQDAFQRKAQQEEHKEAEKQNNSSAGSALESKWPAARVLKHWASAHLTYSTVCGSCTSGPHKSDYLESARKRMRHSIRSMRPTQRASLWCKPRDCRGPCFTRLQDIAHLPPLRGLSKGIEFTGPLCRNRPPLLPPSTV